VAERGDEIRLVRRWFAGRRDVRIVAFEAATGSAPVRLPRALGGRVRGGNRILCGS
jgi:hypothetical protein